MKLLRNCLIAVGLMLIAAAMLGPRLMAQNLGQFLFTPVGNELIQAQSQVNNTAAITYTSISSLRDGRMWVYNVPLTGFTLTMTDLQSVVSLNPAGTLATGAIVLPPTLVDGKSVSLWSSQTITALTLSTSNSATFAPAAPTTFTAGAALEFVYDKANNQWHRFQ